MTPIAAQAALPVQFSAALPSLTSPPTGIDPVEAKAFATHMHAAPGAVVGGAAPGGLADLARTVVDQLTAKHVSIDDRRRNLKAAAETRDPNEMHAAVIEFSDEIARRSHASTMTIAITSGVMSVFDRMLKI